jgi:hypothetical protein
MTAREKLAANDMREELFAAATWHCVWCGGPLAVHGSAQLAHRVPKTKAFLMKWGPEVINDPLNLVPVCSLAHNDAVSLGIVGNAGKALLERIVRIHTGRESMPDLREHYATLRAEFAERRKQ